MSRSLGDDQIPNDKIILNVGGVKYETYRTTLTAYPDTLLGTMFHPRNKEMLHPTNGNEYFIDRNGYTFYYIMEYYRTGSIVWSPALETSSDYSSPPLSSIIPCLPSVSSSHTEVNNATVPTGAAAAVIASTSSFIKNPQQINYINPLNSRFSPPQISSPSQQISTSSSNLTQSQISNNLRKPQSSNSNNSNPHLFPHISLPELEQEFNYFQIPFTSQVSVAQKAAGELLDSFAYAIEEVLCASIAKLIDRISITFYRDGSQMEYLQFSQEGHKLREFSLNGYCIINHFYEDIKKYLEEIFPNMKIKLEFGANYKCLTMSMSHLFTRNTIKEHSKIGKLNKN
ncbi:nucleotide binding protein 1-like protein [Gigaspora margarita]|uniref:Nucleotide binding protein 1-like protein n=1 Tax=Gigaspora margarita TaxID=4874 RepID=A0A8H4AEG4_GIGMA|nr:nucleotide binding protein 1-like protein [Gigaspora margarita]